MNNKTIGTLKISVETCLYLQRVYYEKEGYIALIATLADMGDDSLKHKIIYERIMKEYQEISAEFNLIMESVKNDFISRNPEFEVERSNINLRIDFAQSAAEFFRDGQMCGGCKK